MAPKSYKTITAYSNEVMRLIILFIIIPERASQLEEKNVDVQSDLHPLEFVKG